MARAKLWKIFRLPSPKELGWSSDNALPMSLFKNPNQNGHTWEDWEEKMRKEYPVRYFFAETLPFWFSINIKRKVKDAMYFVTSHVVPSRRYHMLDLRQPKKKGKYSYRWGWIDSDSKMLYALFNIFNAFVKDELPNMYCPSEEEVQANPYMMTQRLHYLEIKAIHYWWNVERERQLTAHSELLNKWSDAKHAHSSDEHQLWDDLQKLEAANDAKEDEMIGRLMKIRRSLWT